VFKVTGVNLTFMPAQSDITYTGDNINAAPTTTPNATASYQYPGDNNHAGAPGPTAQAFLIVKEQPAITLTCPATVSYTGSALTPCTATVTPAGQATQILAVTYLNNTNGPTATAGAQYPGDSNHVAASKTTTFAIVP
jgi:hypothetical protein